MKYRIKNWAEFQHYKDRCPPWIKLHHSLLTSELWIMGNDASRALAVACMLLASRSGNGDGSFSGDPEYVKRFAYLNSRPDFKPLIQYGFIELVQDASNVLAKCNTEERREETENTSAEHEKIVFDGSSFQNAGVHIAVWKKAYPAIDVLGEMAKAAAWLLANPKNRKSNYARFLSNWLSRAQDRAPAKGVVTTDTPPAEETPEQRRERATTDLMRRIGAI